MSHGSPRRLLVVMIAGALAASGCSSVIDTAVRSAGDTVGEAAGEAAGEAIVREYSPAFRQWYVSYLTSLAFYSGGYSVAPATSDYDPGDYTRFNVYTNAEEEVARITRAYLFEDDDGNQGWKVRFLDLEAQDTTIVELLFSPDRSQLLRMRARFPDEEAGHEVPVEENQYYRTPRRLTSESVEGATVGVESLTLPAGTFEARKVEYAAPGTRVTQTWWIVDGVPGGIVQYVHRTPGQDESGDEPESAKGLDGDDYRLELAEHGSGAESELGLEP